MPTAIKVPALGESITEVQIAEWLVKEGATVAKDQNLVSIESEKATVELPSPVAGKLVRILKANGAEAKVGDVIGEIEPLGESQPAAPVEKPSVKKTKAAAEPAVASVPTPQAAAQSPAAESVPAAKEAKKSEPAQPRVMPAAQRVLDEQGLNPEEIEATGPGGRLLKEDVMAHVESAKTSSPSELPAAAPEKPNDTQEIIKPMSLLRRTMAKRLVEAQRTMAILTTFNEVDMSQVMALRKQYQEAFQASHGVKIGFMSFFVKAVVAALKAVPQLNAEIRGNDIVYHQSYDISVAIGAGKGLVVPPLRNAERLSFAAIEKAIADLAARAKENKLKPDEMAGGTFTISNGGIYGSMLSTPIVNPPQSGILGLHAIQDRPVARAGQVVIRPMMFVALSYDHRLVDGREAVTFLRCVKEVIEEPARLMLEV